MQLEDLYLRSCKPAPEKVQRSSSITSNASSSTGITTTSSESDFGSDGLIPVGIDFFNQNTFASSFVHSYPNIFDDGLEFERLNEIDSCFSLDANLPYSDQLIGAYDWNDIVSCFRDDQIGNDDLIGS